MGSFQSGNQINVVSLFNGMGCAWIALDRLGVQVGKRYVSEIDKYANKANDHNYPDSIHLGDVQKVDGTKLGHIDLLVGGSPCQGFSFAGKGLNFDDPRSKLFFEFVRIYKELKEVNPDIIFLLENVRMKREHEVVISKYLGVEPININSNLVSAQNRERLYWTNINARPYNLFGDLIADIPQPKDRGVFLKDILQDENSIDKKYLLSDKAMQRVFKRINESEFSSPGIDPEKSGCLCTRSNSGQLPLDKSTTLITVLDVEGKQKRNQEKASCLTAGAHSGGNHSDMDVICVAMRGRYVDGKVVQQIEERQDGKTNSITTVEKDNFLKRVMQINPQIESGGKQPYQQNRVYDSNGIAPALCAESGKGNIIVHSAQPRSGNGQGGKGHLQKEDGKSYCLDTANSQFIENSKFRRLTPIECCRLQTVPDDYFFDEDGNQIVSDTQIYKMLGNGWTVDVIAHILSHAFQNNKILKP